MAKTTKQSRIMKYGRLVILLNGRHAGRKAVIVKVHEESNADRRFPHALVAGIDRYPRKVHKRLSKTKADRKLKIKPFFKYVNLNHLMATRYHLAAELELDGFNKSVEEVVKGGQKDVLSKPDQRVVFKKKLKTLFETRYRALTLNSNDEKTEKMRFFFSKLRF
jgi:large subunit ribosomal protein L27e